jgi:spermidine synthase
MHHSATDRVMMESDRPVVARPLLLALFCASGFAALVYELLWARELALVFGSTAQATATTLAVFFLGLSAGQHAASRYTARIRNPLRAYGVLEALVAATASTYFMVLPLYRAILPSLVAATGSDGMVAIAARAGVAAVALTAPCVCMGATLPVIGQLFVRHVDELAPTFGLVYAVQTIGGALGAFAAGFWLPGVIGFRRTYLVAMAVSASVAAVAYLASATRDPSPAKAPASHRERRAVTRWADASDRLAAAVACLSGFATLAIEVLWTHMFSQALHNSVYSFAAILVTFLASLSVGGLVARVVARRAIRRPLYALAALLSLSGLGVALSPFLFNWMTGGLRLFASGEGWAGYVRATFGCAAVVTLGPGLLLGSVFPYTLRMATRPEGGAGAVIGQLAFWNTIGAVAGSLCAGFVLLPWLGLWSSIQAVAVLYLLGAIGVGVQVAGQRAQALVLPVVGLFLVASVLNPTWLPRVNLSPGETLKTVRESASGTVAVTEQDGVLALKLDGHYTVGASGAIANDRRQAELPMLLHPEPRSVFFLGLGTGITAGAALFHPVERVTVAELVPDIVTAARESFSPMSNGVFTDARSRVVIGDARTVLAGDPRRYDVIIGDLFVPWQPGAGSLYTREHFESVRARLTANGLFAQWLPLYQLSWREFAVIARTMLEVFPLVTVWRGDFEADMPVVALVGFATQRALDLDVVVANVRRRQGGEGYPEARARALALLFYAGNLTAAQELVSSAPINTDDRPVIEYLAPATPMEVVAGRAEWLTGPALARLWQQLAATVPPAVDPYLASLSDEEREIVEAGRLLHDAAIFRAAGRDADAQEAFENFARRVPPDVARAFGGLVTTR